ncbi:MAG TPA: hypothetical protein VGH65_06855 [Verrucomicrobiaceae bacterium]|jgi:YkoY family integral membrane protein
MGEIFQQLFQAAPLIAMLVVMEGLLSVDNILAIATLASELPESQRRSALKFGLLGAYLSRGLALLFATFIVQSHAMMIMGAAYLIHLTASHFCDLAATGVDFPAISAPPRSYWQTVAAILFLDLSLSLDNVVVAVGVAPNQLWVIYTGVALGLITLWLFASLSLRLIEKYPVLKHAAFLLIGYIGVVLLVEATAHVIVGRLVKFCGSVVIISLCLWHERSPALQKMCRRWFAPFVIPLRLYERILRTLFLPVKKIGSSIRARLGKSGDVAI